MERWDGKGRDGPGQGQNRAEQDQRETVAVDFDGRIINGQGWPPPLAPLAPHLPPTLLHIHGHTHGGYIKFTMDENLVLVGRLTRVESGVVERNIVQKCRRTFTKGADDATEADGFLRAEHGF